MIWRWNLIQNWVSFYLPLSGEADLKAGSILIPKWADAGELAATPERLEAMDTMVRGCVWMINGTLLARMLHYVSSSSRLMYLVNTKT